MSALARSFKSKGYEVSGYDRTPTELTRQLESEGIPVHYEDDPSQIPADRNETLVIYTPAVPESLRELRQVQDSGYRVVKRSRALGELTEGQRCIAVAGTHGKTTTSTLIAHILTDSAEGCTAFLGGISKNYGTNVLMSPNDVVVAEADEFDRSFLQLHPETAVITAMDADHLDIYGDLEHVHEAFRQFASQVSGTLILKYGLPVSGKDTGARILSYHSERTEADFHAENVRLGDDGFHTFDLVHPSGVIKDIRPGAPGWLNVENSIAAAAACLCHGCKPEDIRKAIGCFIGVRRRLDLHLNSPSLSYLDDYAHHPAELATAIASIRQMFPGRRLTAVFQPHLYTRTRDFADEFAAALSAVDKLILLDIYPAREEPIPGVSSRMILDKVTAKEKVLTDKDSLMELLAGEKIDILATFGAGDIDKYVKPITLLLKPRI